LEEEAEEDLEEEPKTKKKSKANKQKDKSPKVVLIPKAVSISEMFNVMNEKLDFLISKLSEK